MDLRQLPLFAMMAKRMSWLADRHSVLAENIANADSPHYQARDLKPFSFERALDHAKAGLRPRATQSAHIRGLMTPANTGTEKQREPYEESLSGNNVVLEEQMMKVAETSMNYQLTANLYQKHLNMLKTAIGRGQS